MLLTHGRNCRLSETALMKAAGGGYLDVSTIGALWETETFIVGVWGSVCRVPKHSPWIFHLILCIISLQIVSLLVNGGADVNDCDHTGCTALIYACMKVLKNTFTIPTYHARHFSEYSIL